MKKDLTNTVSEKLSLPPETIADIPLVQMHGKRRVSVENHRGILEYTDSTVKVSVKRGSLSVIGSGLSILRMTRRCVEISGTIRALEWE